MCIILHRDHGLIVTPRPPLLDGKILFNLHLALDVVHIVSLALVNQSAGDFFVLLIVKDIPPALPSDEEPSTESIGLINVLGSLVGAQVVSSNQQVVFDPHHVVLYSVYLETQVQASFVEKDNLVHFIQLVKNYYVRVLVSWL